MHRIMQEAFGEYLGRLDPPSGAHAETTDDVVAAMARGGAVLAWLEGAGDDPVGSARYELREAGILYASRVAVLPGQRGRGVAREMMAYIEQIARESRRHTVEVGVRLQLPENLALYERLGYAIESVHEHPRNPTARYATLLKRVGGPAARS